jgi:hypothetical protein
MKNLYRKFTLWLNSSDEHIALFIVVTSFSIAIIGLSIMYCLIVTHPEL